MFRYVLLLVAITQSVSVAGWYLAARAPVADNAVRAAEQPLSAASAIWGVIFALYLAFALIALQRREERWVERIAAPLILAGAAIIMWIHLAHFAALPVLNFALLALVCGAAWWSAYRLDLLGSLGGSLLKSLAGALAGLMSGWLTLKTALIIPQIIRAHTDLGVTDYPWLMLWSALIPALTLTGLYTRYISRNVWYFSGLVWGLVMIALSNWMITGTHWLGTGTMIIVGLILYLRLTRGARGATA